MASDGGHAELSARIRAEVEAHGWHIVLVPPGEGGEPAFGFTVGLTTSFEHPELLAIGLDDGETGGTMHQLLDAAAESVADGTAYAEGGEDAELLVGYRVALRAVARKYVPTWLAFLADYYGGESGFRCLQVVWPDPAHRYPWDEAFDADLRARQPVLDR